MDTAQIMRRVESVRSFAPWPELRDDIAMLCRIVDTLSEEVATLRLQRNHLRAQLVGRMSDAAVVNVRRELLGDA